MATQERPSRAFDSFDFRDRRRGPAGQPAPPDRVADDEVESLSRSLRTLGYPQSSIDQILAGPTRTSVEAVQGRIIKARSVKIPPFISEFPVSESPTEGPPADSPPPVADATPRANGGDAEPKNTGIVPPQSKYPRRVKESDFKLDIDQADIVDAVWRSLHGSPSKLTAIANDFEKLTGPLQAYVSAAVVSGRQFLVDLEKWVADFNRAQARKAKERAESEKQQKQIVGTVTGLAAAAANSIPVVGQAISLLIVAAVAIGEAIADAFPLPLREGADQVYDALEGLDAFLGLTLDYSEAGEPPLRQERFLAAKQAVVQDPVAFLLPIPPYRADYKFTPTLEQFRTAAHELGLYAGEGNSVVEEQ